MSQTMKITLAPNVNTFIGEVGAALVQLQTAGAVRIHVAQADPADSVSVGFYLGQGEDDVNAVGFDAMEAGDKLYGKPVGLATQEVCVIASGVVSLGPS